MSYELAPEAGESRRIADDLWDLIERHEDDCDDPDCKFRVNVVAYVAHVVGLRATIHGMAVFSMMERYEATCPNCQSGVGHGR